MSKQWIFGVTYDEDTKKFQVEITDPNNYERDLCVWDKQYKRWLPIQDGDAYIAIANQLKEKVENA